MKGATTSQGVQPTAGGRDGRLVHPRADGRKTDTLRHPLQPPCPSSRRPTQPLPRVSSTYKRVDAGRESMTVDDFTYTSPPVSSALFSVDSVASRFAAYRILTPTPPTPSSRAPLLTCFSREKRPFEVPSLLPSRIYSRWRRTVYTVGVKKMKKQIFQQISSSPLTGNSSIIP